MFSQRPPPDFIMGPLGPKESKGALRALWQAHTALLDALVALFALVRALGPRAPSVALVALVGPCALGPHWLHWFVPWALGPHRLHWLRCFALGLSVALVALVAWVQALGRRAALVALVRALGPRADLVAFVALVRVLRPRAALVALVRALVPRAALIALVGSFRAQGPYWLGPLGPEGPNNAPGGLKMPPEPFTMR